MPLQKRLYVLWGSKVSGSVKSRISSSPESTELANLLGRINATNDIKKLSPEELPGLAAEIRKLILDVVTKTGGHLGSNLGVIELTLALHYALTSRRT